MLNHPHLFLVESDLPTLKNALKWVEQKCHIQNSKGEMVCNYAVSVDNGYIVLLWKGSVGYGKKMAHSRLPFVVEKRDSMFSIYEVIGVEPYLLDLKLLSEKYEFLSGLCHLPEEEKRERHRQRCREWRNANKDKTREYRLNRSPISKEKEKEYLAKWRLENKENTKNTHENASFPFFV